MTDRPFNQDIREKVFSKVVHTVSTKLYDPALNGVNWYEVSDAHRNAIVASETRADFEASMNALLRELHVSHIGFFFMLPWRGVALAWVLLAASLCGLAALVLAIRGTLRVPFLLWSLLVVAMLLWGYVFSNYRFAQGVGVRTAIELMLGSWLALAGAWRLHRGAVHRKSE